MSAVMKIAVMGAGQMGRGIAHVGALGGYEINLYDVGGQEYLEKSLSMIEKSLQKGVDRGKVEASAASEALKRITLFTDLQASVDGAQLVIEAIPEDLAIKQELFSKLDKLCPPKTVFATNTSALSITEIGACTKRASRFIGMHFFIPVHVMKLVEIIRGLETDDASTDLVEEVAIKMGKETVRINEFPGFATSRVNAVIGNEAFNMLMEGVGSAEDIDKAIKLGLNHPMGPFEMIDMVGLDTRLKTMRYLHSTLGEKYRPCPLHVKYVMAGRLGRKVGRGVYDYTEDDKA